MIRSMTGFGSAEVQCEQWTVRVEARSVNHRELQLTCRLPDVFQLKELELRKLLERKVRRGHVYLVLSCRPRSGQSEVLVDEERLRAYIRTLRSVAESEEVPFQLDLATLMRLPGALKDMTADDEMRDVLWPHVVAATEAAVDSLTEMRSTEGANLSRQLEDICAAMEGLVDAVQQGRPALMATYRDRLKERVERLLEGTDVLVNEDSLAREVAFFADRSDVSEEIERLRSHLAQLREALESEDAPVGRKIEFLGQEMLREANTMAAKVPAGAQVRQVLELKSEIERLREQARNVE